jgi:conjugative relaxase-like TrwC/TraI family protein
MVCSVGTGTVAEYYLGEQAGYYTDGREPQGRWYTPSGAFDFENGAAVDDQIFKNLHGGISPDGLVLAQNNQSLKSERVGGYDLTFSAPKSVSVMWAVADGDIRAVIEAAQEKATRAALDVLRNNASYCRRGKGGATLEKVEFPGATFQHGEARPTERTDGSVASDPQLHTHAVIFNIAERDDGTWGALDGRHFYKWKMAAGAIYRAHLASELQRELGVEIEVNKNGLFEVAGISKDIRDHFSSRRNGIEEDLAARGLKTKDAQALASAVTKASRRTKSQGDETAEGRHDRWKREAEALDLTGQTLAGYVGNHVSGQKPETFAERIEQIPHDLTEHEAVFRLETLYRAAAEAALETGASSQDIERGVSNLLSGSVFEIGKDELGLAMYSTEEMIRTEKELVEIAQRGAARGKHRLSLSDVTTQLKTGDLSSEQRMAVESVTTGADICVLEGAAGAGKTHALRSVADVYRGDGYRVIGTSTAWRMANQLGDDLDIESKATDAWLAQGKAGKPFLDDKTVLIVDEAGQLSSAQMLKVLQAAEEAHAKVIFTGDQRQLQAIGAGPGLRLVAEQVGVVRIDTIVRQREAWARTAVEDFSLGRADKAISAFEQRDALRWCGDGNEAVAAAVCDWKDFKSSNSAKTALIMAKTNKQVRALNTQMRHHLREAGQLRGDDHRIKATDSSGRAYDLDVAIGDQVMFKKRIDELRVVNGTTGIVRRIEPVRSGHKMTIDLQGRQIEFTTSDNTDEKGRVPLAHGYAATVYSSQGATVDSAYVVADHTLKRNEIYVAASRARESCRIYLDREEIEKSVRSQMPLSDAARSSIPKARLRQHLSEAWARAQTKSSTRDFSPSLQERNSPRLQAGKALPRIELDR